MLEPVARPLPPLHHTSRPSMRRKHMRSRMNRRLLATAVFVGATGIVLAGCSGGGGGNGNGPGDFGEADGVVTIIGTIADTEAELLEQSWADWEEENDIDIQYESTKEFE